MFTGYAGFIKDVYSENVYGKTYARTTLESSSGQIPIGMDQPAHQKFQTSSGLNHVHHNADSHEKVSQIVGVNRQQDTYAKVSIL